LKQRHQHLVQRDIGTLGATGDSRQRITRPHLVCVNSRTRTLTCTRTRYCRPLRRARVCSRLGGRRPSARRPHVSPAGCRHCLNHARRRCDRGGRNRHRRRRRSASGCRGIEQQRVFTHQPACGPGEFQDHIDKRFLNTAVTGNAKVGAAVGTSLQARLRTWQHCVVLDTGGTVRIRRRDTHPKVRCFFRGQVGDIDLGAQCLTQRRLHLQPSQPKRPCDGCGEAQCSGRYGSQSEAPRKRRVSFQGVSQLVPVDAHTSSPMSTTSLIRFK